VYKQLISSSITKAFRMLKDLSIVATFSSPTTSGFDFKTGLPISSELQEAQAKIVLGKLKKTETSETLQIIVESKVPGVYTKVSINGVVWTIVGTVISNQYTTLLALSRTV
jgi:hypothetical protein